jgi:arylsulfatase A-like enzyme
LYWELVHVPLVIAYPGRLPAGVRIEQPVSNAAIAATVMEMIDAKSAIFPGPSLSNLWGQPAVQKGTSVGAGNPNPWPEVISELPQTNTIVKADRAMEGKEPLATNGWMKSIVSEHWHLIMHEKDGDQIYAWKSDPGELMNLVNTPEGRAARALLVYRAPGEERQRPK